MLTPELERRDIQGIVVSAYAHLPCAEYRLLAVEDPERARRWLHALARDVTTAEHAQAGWSCNVAFTHAGLRALGLPDDALRTFPLALQDGMAAERRACILGDRGRDAPARWRWGGPRTPPVHVLLLLYAARETTMAALVRRLAPDVASGLHTVAHLDAGRQPHDNREHFGFVDGVGQPVIAGSGRRRRQLDRTGHATVLAAGEFLLGYADEAGVAPPTPTVWHTEATRHLAPAPGRDDRRDLGRNGSYLVLRQLQQDVAGFWRAMHAEAPRLWPDDPDAPTRLAAKLVGRWPSGAPLVLHPRCDPAAGAGPRPVSEVPENDFDYRLADPHGHRCPLGAHIRRANPRDALGDDAARALQSSRRHRLLRRGRSYGHRIADRLAPDRADRGIYFVCLNADLERQFEFVQQMWLNDGAFAGLPGEVDPLVGARTGGTSPFSVHADPLRACVPALRSYVRVLGGAYFFLPGVAALRAITAP